jgi:spore coat protein SA
VRILMIAPEQNPIPGGGSVEICMLAIAKQLAKRHQVIIVSRQTARLKKTSQIGNVMIVRVPAGSSAKYIGSVLKFINGKQYDLIQVDNRPHYMAKVKSLFPHTPVCLFLHSLTFVPATKVVAASLQKADLIIANSSSLNTNLSRMFPLQQSVIRTVHLGVDVSRFKPPTRVQKMQNRVKLRLGNAFTILFAGRVIPRKGIGVLIKAANRVRKVVPDIKLLIAGRGKKLYIGKLKSAARKLGVPMQFLGRIGHSKIHHIYRAADCFVCPSQKHEAFGLVNVEAMASGLPVVASNIGGIKEIVRHKENGYLIDQFRSPEQFAKHIVRIANNRTAARQLGRQARKTVTQKFSWSNTASKLATIYKEMI